MKEIEYRGEKLREHPGSEGGHWYLPEGPALVTEILQKNGKWGSINVRHARKLDLFPGCTGVIGIESSFGLVEYYKNMVATAAITMPNLKEFLLEKGEKATIAEIKAQAKSIADAAAAEGTAIHAFLETHMQNRSIQDLAWCEENAETPYYAHLVGVYEALERAGCPLAGWTHEKVAVHELGYGCKADLAHYDRRILLDIKTKEFGPDEMEKLKTWDNHAEQLWANAQALDLYDADKGILFVSRNHPGLAKVVWISEDLSPWRIFVTKLDLFQQRKGLTLRVENHEPDDLVF